MIVDVTLHTDDSSGQLINRREVAKALNRIGLVVAKVQVVPRALVHSPNDDGGYLSWP